MLISRSASQVTTHKQPHPCANNSALTLDHMLKSIAIHKPRHFWLRPPVWPKAAKPSPVSWWGFWEAEKLLSCNHNQSPRRQSRSMQYPHCPNVQSASKHLRIHYAAKHVQHSKRNPANADCPSLECLNIHQTVCAKLSACKILCRTLTFQDKA